jgi:hypothetical protein
MLCGYYSESLHCMGTAVSHDAVWALLRVMTPGSAVSLCCMDTPMSHNAVWVLL